ncbi:MAG: hypothetical protein J0I49_07480 [Pseudonocardia sp.]|uniref:Zn-ribbon domain-containing OB-fold protein n=1 Tax=Pseudonocardia sp. TaxID=60912 RepID=UPI001AC22430|nr:zinc ribbon domain-containing protein [Pseudonocardia sp.]MBN9097938.1 hypothetical protein [Pseudonocardia sp.]
MSAPDDSAAGPWVPDTTWPVLQEFWAAARTGHLVFPRCTACGRYQWYPQAMCPACRAMAFAWDEVAPDGYVFSHTTLRRSFVPGADGQQARHIVLVKFLHVPGVTLVTNVREDVEPRVDLRARIAFDEVAPGVSLPVSELYEV